MFLYRAGKGARQFELNKHAHVPLVQIRVLREEIDDLEPRGSVLFATPTKLFFEKRILSNCLISEQTTHLMQLEDASLLFQS